MRTVVVRFVVAALVWGALAGTPARAEDARYDGARAQGRAVLEELVRTQPIPGLSVAVAVHGRIVWSEAFGLAHVEADTPATPATRFRIASVSKPLTAVAAAVLAQEGRLDLDAPIQTYVPEFPEKPGPPMTARRLAGHLGGVRHYRGNEIRSTRHYPTLSDALAIFADDDLVAPPGERMTYTTYGYTLLGVVMERAAGADFETLMRDTLFEPLGMTATVVDHHAEIIVGRSGFYSYDTDAGLRNAPLTDHSYKIPGGGFLSTAEDLVRFGSSLLEPGLLEPAMLETVLTPMRTADGRSTGYAMGWSRRADGADRRLFTHGGNQPGGRSQLLGYRDEGVVVAMLTNLGGAAIGGGLAQRVAEPFLAVGAGGDGDKGGDGDGDEDTGEEGDASALFDGVSLDGWHAVGGGAWRVDDGAIVGTLSRDERAHGLLVSDGTYDDFTVTFEYRLRSGDSGFYFRSEKTGTVVGVRGFQIEVDDVEPGGLYETDGRGWVVKHVPEKAATWHRSGAWNRVVLEARGTLLVVRVNGIEATRLDDPQGRRSGHFALQLHGGQDMNVAYRDIRLVTP